MSKLEKKYKDVRPVVVRLAQLTKKCAYIILVEVLSDIVVILPAAE